MKLHRMTYVVFLFFLGVYVLGNHLLPVSDPVESNYALTAKEMVWRLVVSANLWALLVR